MPKTPAPRLDESTARKVAKVMNLALDGRGNEAQMEQAALTAMRLCREAGVTTFEDFLASFKLAAPAVSFQVAADPVDAMMEIFKIIRHNQGSQTRGAKPNRSSWTTSDMAAGYKGEAEIKRETDHVTEEMMRTWTMPIWTQYPNQLIWDLVNKDRSYLVVLMNTYHREGAEENLLSRRIRAILEARKK